MLPRTQEGIAVLHRALKESTRHTSAYRSSRSFGQRAAPFLSWTVPSFSTGIGCEACSPKRPAFTSLNSVCPKSLSVYLSVCWLSYGKTLGATRTTQHLGHEKGWLPTHIFEGGGIYDKQSQLPSSLSRVKKRKKCFSWYQHMSPEKTLAVHFTGC